MIRGLRRVAGGRGGRSTGRERARSRGTAVAAGEIMCASESIAARACPLALAACALVGGCSTTGSPDHASAQQLFATRAWPALGRCTGCHATQPTIDFLAPGTATEAYATMFAFQPPIVDVASPASSLVLTMGKHTGPALLAVESDAVLAWLEAERVERVPDRGAVVSVGPVSLALGAVNVVDLGHGATLQFVPAAAAEGLAVRGLALTAGSTGLRVVHPLFATDPPLVPSRVDAADTFDDVELELSAGAVEVLGGGSAVFPEFDPADPITIHFRTLESP
jgi:hypothetical protein